MAGDADLDADGAGLPSQTEEQAPFWSPEMRARLVGQIHALTAVRLALAAAVTLALAPTSLIRGGAGSGDGDEQGSGQDGAPWESKDGAGTMMAAATVLASPVVYAGLLALIFYRRPRGVVGAAVLLAIGLTEGAAIGGTLALVGWAWVVKMVS